MTDIEAMSLAAVQAELRAYDPSSAAAVPTEAHRERRQALWRRLDALLGVRKPAAVRS